jgi:RND family efflux transporter MFP subunit
MRFTTFTLGFALSIICLAAACSGQHSTDEGPRPVKTLVVVPLDEPDVRSFPGKVEASKSVDLAFQVPGLLVKFQGKEGDRVARGQVIAQLRQDEFRARLKTAQGQLDQARAALDALRSGERSEEQLRREAQLRAAEAKLANAKTEVDRYARLVASSAVSRSEYELAETAYRVAQEDQKVAVQIAEKGTAGRREDIEAQEGVVRGLEGRVAEADLQLKDSTLRAPYNGIIAQRLVDEEQTITASSAVVKFQDGEEIDIVVDVPETFMPTQMRSGEIVKTMAEFSTAPGRRFPVRLKEATQVADPKTQTFQVRFAMTPVTGFTPLPGMTATVSVAYRPGGAQGNRIFVPVSAVARLDTGEQVVWVMGRNDTVSPRPVTMGVASGGQIEIIKGLKRGERIVIAGVTFLHDGMKVRDLGDALASNQR